MYFADTAKPETASFLTGLSHTVLNKPFTLESVRLVMVDLVAARQPAGS